MSNITHCLCSDSSKFRRTHPRTSTCSSSSSRRWRSRQKWKTWTRKPLTSVCTWRPMAARILLVGHPLPSSTRCSSRSLPAGLAATRQLHKSMTTRQRQRHFDILWRWMKLRKKKVLSYHTTCAMSHHVIGFVLRRRPKARIRLVM